MTGDESGRGRAERTRRRFVGSAAATVAVGLAGCSGSGFGNDGGTDADTDTDTDGSATTGPTTSSDGETSVEGWPTFRADAANTGTASAAGPGATPTTRWTADVGGPGLSSPVVADGVVLAGSEDGLRAFTTDGDPAWEAPTDAPVTATPAVAGNRAYVADADGTLYAVGITDGSVQWRAALRADAFGFGRTAQQIDPAVHSSPTVAGGTVFVGGDDGAVYAFDAETGDPEWRRRVRGDGFPPRGQVAAPAVATPAVADGIVYAAAGPTVAALVAETGDPEWRTDAPAAVTASPAVRGGVVHAASLDGSVLALAADNGDPDWSAARGGRAYPPSERSEQERLVVDSSPAVAEAGGDAAVVLRGDGATHAFDGTGEPLWTAPDADGAAFGPQQQAGSPVRSSPAAGPERAYVGTDRGVVALGLADGEREFAFGTERAVVASPALVDGTLYAVDRDGTLYALAT
ncbi:outer membrane protein assembly factor BamB family protein [Halostella salina]|uniref:outer membrane protein assembly factor BamB family protein n=1 Tax=Halostella salina TaxID=1547897 RepID=UPI000EF7E4A3|nr:PQQ-binding-like beta-propeller repeat protein [Halostella salina]